MQSALITGYGYEKSEPPKSKILFYVPLRIDKICPSQYMSGVSCMVFNTSAEQPMK